jgi:hypothetical protein
VGATLPVAFAGQNSIVLGVGGLPEPEPPPLPGLPALTTPICDDGARKMPDGWLSPVCEPAMMRSGAVAPFAFFANTKMRLFSTSATKMSPPTGSCTTDAADQSDEPGSVILTDGATSPLASTPKARTAELLASSDLTAHSRLSLIESPIAPFKLVCAPLIVRLGNTLPLAVAGNALIAVPGPELLGPWQRFPTKSMVAFCGDASGCAKGKPRALAAAPESTPAAGNTF